MSNRPLALVVDDSKPFLMYLSILLKRMNLDVLPVTSAEEAFEVARIARPQLVTLDIRMPGMDGIEALRVLRKDADLASLPVIMISSHLEKNRHWEAQSLGCVDVLSKPVELRRLHQAVQRCDLYPGGRRRYMRACYTQKVTIHTGERSMSVPSVTLSERGIYVHMQELLGKGTRVELDIPLPSGEVLHVGGTVIYVKTEHGVDSMISRGLAVKFNRLSLKDSEALTELVSSLLIDDILSEQTEPVVTRENPAMLAGPESRRAPVSG